MTDQGKKALITERYMRAAHRVQTAIEFSPDKTGQEPKHLRVGVDLSKSDMGGLAQLLINKGLITEEEYLLAITKFAEQEATHREDEFSVRFGINVRTL